MPLFLDASALAKGYLQEGRSTQRMKDVLGRPLKLWGGLVASGLIEPEVVSALAKQVRESRGEIQKTMEQRLPHVVRAFRLGLSAIDIVVPDEHICRFAATQLRDNPHWEIGGADAVHLATAVTVRNNALAAHPPLVFVTSDAGLRNAAAAMGFTVFDPVYDEVEGLLARFTNL